MNNKSDEKAKSAGNAINKLNTHTHKQEEENNSLYVPKKKRKIKIHKIKAK